MSEKSDESKNIRTDEGDIIRWLPKNVDNYLDKTTLLFGGTFSGKTTIIEEILYLTREYIPNYIVVASSNSRKAYINKLPGKCIKKDLTKAKIQGIWDRQSNVTQLYDTANDIKILESLFNKIPDRESIVMINAVNRKANECYEIIESVQNLNFAQKKAQHTAVEELQIKRIKDIYKATIRKNTYSLSKLKLTQHEKVALDYIDLNPRLMIILDDVTDLFSKWMSYFKKSEVNPFDSIFYQGRHNYITLVFGAHDDKIVDTEFRKNSRCTIFTTSQSLVTSMEKKANGYTAKEKKLANRVASKIFEGETNGIKSHQKLCYVREDMCPFRYTIANLYPDFTLGSTSLRDLVAKMPNKSDTLSDNKYIKKEKMHKD